MRAKLAKDYSLKNQACFVPDFFAENKRQQID